MLPVKDFPWAEHDDDDDDDDDIDVGKKLNIQQVQKECISMYFSQ